MTDEWGANSFPVHKQLPNLLFLMFVDRFLVFSNVFLKKMLVATLRVFLPWKTHP